MGGASVGETAGKQGRKLGARDSSPIWSSEPAFLPNLETETRESEKFLLIFFFFWVGGTVPQGLRVLRTWATAAKVGSPNHWTSRELPYLLRWWLRW